MNEKSDPGVDQRGDEQEQAKYRVLIATGAASGRRSSPGSGWARAGSMTSTGPRSRLRSSTTATGSRCTSYETEKQMRIALACGSFFFVLLGAPVGILFAKGDFLSAFITASCRSSFFTIPLTSWPESG